MKSGLTSPERVAAIDIGTNTILLLIAEVNQGVLKALEDRETVVRLGAGLHQTGDLSDEAMGRGVQALDAYLRRCQEMEIQRVFAVGTSALREARNADRFRQRVKDRFHLDIEVISGEEEARLSFLAVTRDLSDPGGPLLVVDVGGGSTEIILGRGGHVHQWVSLPIGIVRLTENFLVSDPVRESEYQAMSEAIEGALREVLLPDLPLTLVSIGGTGTALASVAQGLESFQVEKIHRYVLTKEELERQLWIYRSTTLQERREIRGLPLSRADVILAGATILHRIMGRVDCSSLLISTHGVRYGLLYERLGIGSLNSPSRPAASESG